MKIRIASSDPLSTFYTQAGLLADLLRKSGVIEEAEVVPTTGSVINAEMTARGDSALGFMASNWVPRAVAGGDPFTAPVDVAIVTPLNAGPLFFVAPASSKLTSVRELKGKPIAVGHANSGMAQHANNIVRGFGWQGDDVQFAHISTFDGGTALIDGSVAAQLSAPIPSTHFDDLQARLDIKVLDFDPADIANLCKAHPFYSTAVVPAEEVKGLRADVPALAVLNVIVAAGHADDDFVFNVVRAYINGAKELERANALFRGLPAILARARTDGVAALAPGGAPFHPVAARAFREAGLLAD
jgi:TRAP transporter TAXI family solute receptor